MDRFVAALLLAAVVAPVLTGSAIVYGSTTDNITNDPAVQFATVFVSPS